LKKIDGKRKRLRWGNEEGGPECRLEPIERTEMPAGTSQG